MHGAIGVLLIVGLAMLFVVVGAVISLKLRPDDFPENADLRSANEDH